ncbi:MAG: DNA replication and repair protein RecF [Ferruginibacter sp.]|nr:DNA replication and repair protein RecF [Ferruginibacter sp.]
MRLKHISITQYKNYEYFNLPLHKMVVGISGKNGRGKTNLLDAVFYGCFTRSYFTSSDQWCARQGESGFRLELDFELEDELKKVVCIYRGGNKKEILLNDVPYEKFSQHIGTFPVVMIAPDDIELITDGSEVRRKFIDTMISQLNPEYLQLLIRYNKILAQRNSVLKQWHTQPNHALLDILDEQWIPTGKRIYEIRKQFLLNFMQVASTFYTRISGESYVPGMLYQSALEQQSFDILLHESRQKDIHLQRSTTGIHKDDLLFTLGALPFRTIASQGQRKSLLFALKFAEYEIIRQQKKHCLLLLDDVFEKLDEQRIQNLMQWVCEASTGQVLITDTHRERLEKTFKDAGIDAQFVSL